MASKSFSRVDELKLQRYGKLVDGVTELHKQQVALEKKLAGLTGKEDVRKVVAQIKGDVSALVAMSERLENESDL
jgi:hypothetical protein